MSTFKRMLAVLGMVSLVWAGVPMPSLGDRVAVPEIAKKSGSEIPIKQDKLTSRATYSIWDCWWTEPLDRDGDGYTQERKLHIDADTTLSSESVYLQIWYRLVGSSTWVLDWQTAPFTIERDTSDDAQYVWIGTNPQYPHGTYEFNVQLFSAAGVWLTSHSNLEDPDLGNITFETPAQDASPEIDVRGNGISILTGDTTPSIADGTDFGSTPVGTFVEHTFYIHNTGTAPLSLSNFSCNPSFTVTVDPVVLIAVGGTYSFTVRLDATGPITYSSDISFENNDVNENPLQLPYHGHCSLAFPRPPLLVGSIWGTFLYHG